MREQKVQEQERVKRNRRFVRRGIGAVFVIGIIVLIVFLLAGNNSATPSAKGTTTTVKGATTTTVKSATTTTVTSATTTSTGPTTTTVNPCTVTTPYSNSGTVPTGTIPSTPPTTEAVCKTAIAPTCPPATAAGAVHREIAFTKAPATCIDKNDIYVATFVTDLGTFQVTMNPKTSLAAVNNFVFLARYHFFDGIIFHRVIPGFVVQGGDPTGTGSGGPGYSWTGNVPPKGCTKKSDCYETGSIAMANSSGPSTNGSQFFLVLPGGANTLNSEPNYTNFGQVTSGLSVVEKIGTYGTSTGTPTKALYMVKVTISQTPA
jgi:cyclophilin family peptidyl-prolyl cis-trans isomerase